MYGDGSARWYGDPQQRMIWWPVVATGSGVYHSTYASVICGWDRDYSDSTVNYNCNGSVMLWHLLDMANGVDVDAFDLP